MVGSRFSEVMFIPPKFAPKFSSHVGKETFLEDWIGLRWKVKLAYVEGSLAIHEDCNAFASDRDLSLGDFVAFSYIAGSYFVVQMWDRTGCGIHMRKQKQSRKDNKKYWDEHFDERMGSFQPSQQHSAWRLMHFPG